MKQLSFFEKEETVSEYLVESFSAGNFSEDYERKKLEHKYSSFLEVSQSFNRQSVSYQLSKNARLHSWLKYREGFSSELVNTLLDEMNIKPGDLVMDPFFGSGTTALSCQIRGINSIGYDVLPISRISIEAKKNVFKYDTQELKDMISELKEIKVPDNFTKNINSIRITYSAYPDSTDRMLAYIKHWNLNSNYSSLAKNLLNLCMINTLEQVSYTRKDGQYLRWDHRSKKTIEANKKRIEAGKKPITTVLDKGDLPDPTSVIIQEFNNVLNDIFYIQSHYKPTDESASIQYIENSILKELPKFEKNTIDGVITSPPYCNRYDYTRTYALELAFLGLDDEEIKELRQTLLSATVENKSKVDELREYYTTLGREEDFDRILHVISSNPALNEAKLALSKRANNGEINNKGILRMVDGYFLELGLIYAELFRISKSGAKIAFVNDNVRYGGEVIPVDFISSELAENFGFHVSKIYCLEQQKGNSSQQMKKYGRVPLRKSITIWEKP